MKVRQILLDVFEARTAATLENASFSRISTGQNDVPYPTCESEVDAFIKDRVKLHHDTWIVGMLDEAIVELRKGLSRGRK